MENSEVKKGAQAPTVKFVASGPNGFLGQLRLPYYLANISNCLWAQV